MTYRSMPRTNYFAYIIGMNAIVAAFSALGIIGIFQKDAFLMILGLVGVLVFFAALYAVIQTVIHLDNERDEVAIENIKAKYGFHNVDFAETSVEERVKYGMRVIVSSGNVPEELFLTTNAKTSEPYLYRVADGEKTLVDEEFAQQNQSVA